ncbi:hypothetical protein FRB93_011614 [Tulasnella sp. JGI-2019a]|nr:hypothetical protein FRB93_011614 [Tulasnella sp. JGI-2019a]
MAASDVQQALVKTHRLTIVLATPLSSTLGQLKENIVSALQQFEDEESAAGVPRVSDAGDFEVCRLNVTTKKYSIISTSGANAKTTIKDAGLKAWEKLFLRFKDEEGNLAEVEVDIPPLLDEDED